MLSHDIPVRVLILVLFSTSAVAFAAVLEKSSEQFDSLELSKIEPLSSEEAALAPRANWQPICQQVLINPSEANPVVLSESDVVFVPQDIPGIVISPGRTEAKSCIAPNGGGLTTFLREVYEILPHDRLNAIKFEAAKDPDVQKFVEFLNSQSFRNRLLALSKTNAFVVFRDYACQKLYLDVDELLQFGGVILDVSASPKALTARASFAGVQGLLADIKSALPLEEIKTLFKKKLAEDEYLRIAKDLIKSAEFVAISKAVADQPEYKTIVQAFEENGFKFELVVEYARQAIDPQCSNLN